MKVILSVEPIRYPLTGIGRYTFELARNLANLHDIEELRFFAGTDFVAELPNGAEAASSAPATRLQTVKRTLARLPFLLDIYRHRIDQARRTNLAGLKDAVYHGPNFYLPPTEGPSVVTVHDLSILKMPECHPPERVAYMSKEIDLALSRATMIVTDSE
ncbi:MAG TPA: hypothetical protein VGN98_12055, partial [Tianweitania sediminis]|nr:hypothetical protein [Tianweitania sediminis]